MRDSSSRHRFGRGRAGLLVALVLTACGTDSPPPETLPVQAGPPETIPESAKQEAEESAVPLAFVLEQPFEGDTLKSPVSKRVGGYAAFDVVATDMDLDGDMDILINWHLAGIELFENTGEGLKVLNARGADSSGLTLQPGIPALMGEWTSRLDELASDSEPSISVWHESNISWYLYLVAPPAGDPIPIEIACNEETQVEGLEADESVSKDGESIDLLLHAGGPPRLLHLINEYPCAYLRLHQPGTQDRTPLPYQVGHSPVTLPGPTIALRKPDPHGVAWVQISGSPEPEMVISRGGNRGTLAVPDVAKSNRVYTYRGGDPLYEQVPIEAAPRDYARGRGVEWVDVDNDGVNELSLANRNSANALWVLNPEDGTYRDGARPLSLTYWSGQAAAWIDVDRDGWQDQLLMDQKILRIARNRGGLGFTSLEGDTRGLSLPNRFNLQTQGFEKTGISVFDLDADGELDVWVSSIGNKGFHKVFRRVGRGFKDVTARLGLATLSGTGSCVRIDVDDDGYVDVVTLGATPLLLWNRGGKHFRRVPLHQLIPGLPQGSEPAEQLFAVTAADMDADGRKDLVIIAQERYVAYNRTENANRALLVHVKQGTHEPIGTLVRVHRDDGFSRVERYGSADRSFVSQVLQPLHFGIAAGTKVTAVEVLWPGETEWTPCELPEGDELRLVR